MITLNEAMQQAKLTKTQLVERYRIPLRTLQDWEAGRRTPPEYVLTMLLRCIETDFNVRLKDPDADSTPKRFVLTYTNGSPLSLADERFVESERAAGNVEICRGVDAYDFVTYKCSSGFQFKVKQILAKPHSNRRGF